MAQNQTAQSDAVVAVFTDRQDAEAGIKKLAQAGFDIKKITLVGKGYHTDDKVVGFYNLGDRVKFWGKNGAFWGGLWGVLFGGIFLTVPAIGPVVVLGYLATVVVSAVEGALVVGGLSALGAALYSIGISKDSVINYETAVKADGFLVMVHGNADEVTRAKTILSTANASRLDVHQGLREVPATGQAAA
jgi:hypothetical protein